MKLDIKAKFGIVIGVVLLAVVLCGWSGIHATNGLNSHVKTLYTRDFNGMRTIADLNVQLGHVQDEAGKFPLTRVKGESHELGHRALGIPRELNQLKSPSC